MIAEHRWWLNTRVPEDVAYIYRLTDRYPEFFKVLAKPMGAPDRVGYAIWQYMSDCTEPDTMYLRLDDDICYIAEDAIRQMRDFRLHHREPLLVLGNIVNNAICTHYQQQAGVVPKSWGLVGKDCMDERGWKSGPFARRVHRRFLKDLASGREEHWKNTAFPYEGDTRFSVSAICWFGDDFREIPELGASNIDEEPFMTAVLPARMGRPNMICPRALFGHYAFCTQRAFLETTSPEILAHYRRLAEQAAPMNGYALSPWEHSVLRVRRLWGVTGWAAQQSVAAAGAAYRTGKQRLRSRAA